MRNFNQGGGGRFGRNRGSDRGPVTMHRAICSKCGRDCEVPFRPTGDKPIYCNDCFGANRDRGGDRDGQRFPRRDFGGSTGSPRGDDEVKKQLEFLGLKIDRLVKAVENLSSAKTAISSEKSAEVKEVLKTIKKKVAKKVKA